MGSREVPYDKDAICDDCGNQGAHDFMGDYICDGCIFINEVYNLLRERLSETRGFNPLILAYRGSLVHGTYIPDHIDDKDIIGTGMYDIDYYLGIKNPGKGTTEIKEDDKDIVYHEIRKFISLLLKGNPNVVSVLWLDSEYYLEVHELAQWMIDYRDKFMSKRILHAFLGYAGGQLKRMQRNNYEGYMSAKRKQIVDEFGYDCKNAAHGIRLLRMGIELAKTSSIFPHRHDIDASYLLNIKNGKYSLEYVKGEADHLANKLKEVMNNTDLPKHPDYTFINEKMVEMLFNILNNK